MFMSEAFARVVDILVRLSPVCLHKHSLAYLTDDSRYRKMLLYLGLCSLAGIIIARFEVKTDCSPGHAARLLVETFLWKKILLHEK